MTSIAVRRVRLPFWPAAFLAVVGWLIAWFAAAPFAAWFAYDLLGLEQGSHLGDAVSFFAFDVPNHAAQISAQAFRFSARTFQLLRARVTSLLLQRSLAHPRVALPQVDPSPPGFAHQHQARFLVQPRIRRKGDGFLLHRRIHIHPPQLSRLQR